LAVGLDDLFARWRAGPDGSSAISAGCMNAIMERWVGSVRREVLDRMLIVNAAHLRQVLSEYESHFNGHRPHRALNHASPLRALPDPVDADIKVTRRDRLGGASKSVGPCSPWVVTVCDLRWHGREWPGVPGRTLLNDYGPCRSRPGANLS
jgi:Integrase core domain